MVCSTVFFLFYLHCDNYVIGLSALAALPLCNEKLRREAVLPSLVACLTRNGLKKNSFLLKEN